MTVSNGKMLAVAAAASAAAIVAFRWHRSRKSRAEETEDAEEECAEDVSVVKARLGGPMQLDLQEAVEGSTEVGTSEERSNATTPLGLLSPAAAVAKAAALEVGCQILACPWHDQLAFYLNSSELSKVSQACTVLREEVTVDAPEGSDTSPKRLLLVPALELKIETVEAELRVVSLEHVRILRVWQRMSLNAVVDAVRQSKGRALRNLDKFVCKGCPLHPADVTSVLAPVLENTQFLKLLNLEKNQMGDASVKAICDSGILAKVDTLNLRFNLVGDEGAKALAACPSAKKLRWINLKMNRVRDAGALALGKMLEDPQCNMTLLNLRRQTPGISDRGALGLAEMLRSNKNLEYLRLRRNKVTNKGAVALAAAVEDRMQRLCKETLFDQVKFELDLEENKVGDEGAVALLRAASAVPQRAKLEVLLHNNQVTRESLQAALALSGEPLDASNPRMFFNNKPEGEL